MQSLDDEKAALPTAKRQLLPLQKQKSIVEPVSKEIETKQQKHCKKWNESDLELGSADSKQAHAKHEMAIFLVAEQTAENAKVVNQGSPVVQAHTTGSTTDQAAQQTILSVFK